jgi:hypothetical protein
MTTAIKPSERAARWQRRLTQLMGQPIGFINETETALTFIADLGYLGAEEALDYAMITYLVESETLNLIRVDADLNQINYFSVTIPTFMVADIFTTRRLMFALNVLR